MKVAPIIAAIDGFNARPYSVADAGEAIQHVLVHTGQHYGPLMSDAFFTDLTLPQPDVHLNVGSGSHASQCGEIMKKFEEVLLSEQPDVLIVVGDVNSTVACALVAAKVSFDPAGRRPLIAHVESGLRSFDRAMPEEINRVVTDHIADVLFVTEESGLQNLCREGLAANKMHFVGNTMIDSLSRYSKRAEESLILDKLHLRSAEGVKRYALLTLHRPANVDNHSVLMGILEGLDGLRAEMPVVFPAHPRTQQHLHNLHLDAVRERRDGNAADVVDGKIAVIDPLGYLDFLCLMKNAALVVTDSGGIQEETTWLRVPCVTARENTERPVTLTVGTNVLAGVTTAGIRQAIRDQLSGGKPQNGVPKFWDGNSSSRIVETLVSLAKENDAAFAPLRA